MGRDKDRVRPPYTGARPKKPENRAAGELLSPRSAGSQPHAGVPKPELTRERKESFCSIGGGKQWGFDPPGRLGTQCIREGASPLLKH